jgi:type IV pilus assembly protein PilA
MRSRQNGFTLIELLVVLAIIAMVLAVAIPNIKSALRNSNETVVMREVQTIHQAQVQYFSLFGAYAATLSELGPPGHGVAQGPKAANLIPASLASGEKNGYTFTLAQTPTGYAVHANPKVYGGKDTRTFYLDENGVLHQNQGSEPATDESPEVK